MQPPVYIPTDWLSVGHVDETITFVKADTPRGWAMLVGDPRLARDMLEEQERRAHGSALMFTGLYWEQELAETSVSAVLADTDVMSASAEAVAEIAAQIEILRTETGITDAEIVRIPFLYSRDPDGAIAYQPATVNGVYLSERDFAAPRPHGPVIGGRDIFETQLEQSLSAIGLRVHFIETWNLYHTRGGEVHCGTNATRRVPSVNWWETGR
jgi:protein-arginine deiminase